MEGADALAEGYPVGHKLCISLGCIVMPMEKGFCRPMLTLGVGVVTPTMS